MTTTELRIAVLLAAIVVIYLLVKLYLHVLRSRVIPAIEPEARPDDGASEPDEAGDGDAAEVEGGGSEGPPRG